MTFRKRLSNREYGGPLSALWPPIREALAATEVPDVGDTAPRWDEVDPDDAATHIAFCSVQTLAYSVRRGDRAVERRAADALIAGLGRCRTWVSGGMGALVDPETLRLPSGGYSYGSSPLFSDATFEEDVLVVTPTAVTLLVWEDED